MGFRYTKFSVDVDGERISMEGEKYAQVGDRVEGGLSISNNQKDSAVKTLFVRAILNNDELPENISIGITVFNSASVFSSGKEVENARESGIEFPREKNPDKWNSEALLYDGRFKEADQIGIFYGAPFNDDEITKEQYRNLKQKLLDTNFLGTDAKKRTTFVKAMEKGIELMLGMEELKKIDTSPSTGPERLINKNTGNELNL